MRFELRARSLIAAATTLCYGLTNVLGAYAAESDFWSRRKSAADHARTVQEQTLMAQLPAAARFSMEGSALPGAGGLPPAAAGGTAAKLEAPMQDLPGLIAPFGTLRDAHLSKRPGAPLIIHIQDAHEIEEAQKNIAAIVQNLSSSGRVGIVGLEGAQGVFALDAYRVFPDADVARAVADHLLSLGYVSGAEWAGLTAPRPPLLWGVEDADAYLDNLRAVDASLKSRPDFEKRVNALKSRSTDLARRLFSPRLADLDRRSQDYAARRLPLGDYARFLLHAYRGDATPFANVRLLEEALQWEETLDFKEAEKERRDFAERLAGALSPTELRSLVAQSLSYRAGRMSCGDYHRLLRNAGRAHGIDFSRYGVLETYMTYVQLVERIDRDGLMSELPALEKKLQDSWSETAAQRELAQARRDLDLLGRLAAQSMTPADWGAYLGAKARILRLPVALNALNDGPRYGEDERPFDEKDLAPFENFCLKALDRNEVMVRNLLAKMRAEKSAAAVLVAGGFHTDGLTRILRREDASYVVVTPRIEKSTADNRSLEVFSREARPIEKLFAGEVVNVKSPLLTAADGRFRQSFPRFQRMREAMDAVAASFGVFLMETWARRAGRTPTGWVAQGLSVGGTRVGKLDLRSARDMKISLRAPAGVRDLEVVEGPLPTGMTEMDQARFALPDGEVHARLASRSGSLERSGWWLARSFRGVWFADREAAGPMSGVPQGGLFEELRREVEPVFEWFFSKFLGDARGRDFGRFAYRAVGGPLLEDTIGGLKPKFRTASALLAPIIGHLVLLWLGPAWGGAVFGLVLTAVSLRFIVLHPRSRRVDAEMITLIGLLSALGALVLVGVGPAAFWGFWAARFSVHVIYNAVLNIHSIYYVNQSQRIKERLTDLAAWLEDGNSIGNILKTAKGGAPGSGETSQAAPLDKSRDAAESALGAFVEKVWKEFPGAGVRQGTRVLSEGDALGRGAGLTFLVDPLDGIRAHSQGESNYAFSFVVIERILKEEEGRPFFAAVFEPESGVVYGADVDKGDKKRVWRIKGADAPQPQGLAPVVAQGSQSRKMVNPMAGVLEKEFGKERVVTDVPSMTLMAAKMASGELGEDGAYLSSLFSDKTDSAIAAAFFKAARWRVTVPTTGDPLEVIRIDPDAWSVPLPIMAAPLSTMLRFRHHYHLFLRERVNAAEAAIGLDSVNKPDWVTELEGTLGHFKQIPPSGEFIRELKDQVRRALVEIKGDAEILIAVVGGDLVVQVHGLAKAGDAPGIRDMTGGSLQDHIALVLMTSPRELDIRGPVIVDGTVSLQWRIPAGPQAPWKLDPSKIERLQRWLDEHFEIGDLWTEAGLPSDVPVAQVRLSPNRYLATYKAPVCDLRQLDVWREGREGEFTHVIEDVPYPREWPKDWAERAKKAKTKNKKINDRPLAGAEIAINIGVRGVTLQDVINLPKLIENYYPALKRSNNLPIRDEWTKIISKTLGINLWEVLEGDELKKVSPWTQMVVFRGALVENLEGKSEDFLAPEGRRRIAAVKLNDEKVSPLAGLQNILLEYSAWRGKWNLEGFPKSARDRLDDEMRRAAMDLSQRINARTESHPDDIPALMELEAARVRPDHFYWTSRPVVNGSEEEKFYDGIEPGVPNEGSYVRLADWLKTMGGRARFIHPSYDGLREVRLAESVILDLPRRFAPAEAIAFIEAELPELWRPGALRDDWCRVVYQSLGIKSPTTKALIDARVPAWQIDTAALPSAPADESRSVPAGEPSSAPADAPPFVLAEKTLSFPKPMEKLLAMLPESWHKLPEEWKDSAGMAGACRFRTVMIPVEASSDILISSLYRQSGQEAPEVKANLVYNWGGKLVAIDLLDDDSLSLAGQFFSLVDYDLDLKNLKSGDSHANRRMAVLKGFKKILDYDEFAIRDYRRHQKYEAVTFAAFKESDDYGKFSFKDYKKRQREKNLTLYPLGYGDEVEARPAYVQIITAQGDGGRLFCRVVPFDPRSTEEALATLKQSVNYVIVPIFPTVNTPPYDAIERLASSMAARIQWGDHVRVEEEGPGILAALAAGLSGQPVTIVRHSDPMVSANQDYTAESLGFSLLAAEKLGAADLGEIKWDVKNVPERGVGIFKVSGPAGGTSLLNMFAGDNVERIRERPWLHLGGAIGGESLFRTLSIFGVFAAALGLGAEPVTALLLGAFGGGTFIFAFAHTIVGWVVNAFWPEKEFAVPRWKDKLPGSFSLTLIFLAPFLIAAITPDPFAFIDQIRALISPREFIAGSVASWLLQFVWDAVIVYFRPQYARRLLDSASGTNSAEALRMFFGGSYAKTRSTPLLPLSSVDSSRQSWAMPEWLHLQSTLTAVRDLTEDGKKPVPLKDVINEVQRRWLERSRLSIVREGEGESREDLVWIGQAIPSFVRKRVRQLQGRGLVHNVSRPLSLFSAEAGDELVSVAQPPEVLSVWTNDVERIRAELANALKSYAVGALEDVFNRYNAVAENQDRFLPEGWDPFLHAVTLLEDDELDDLLAGLETIFERDPPALRRNPLAAATLVMFDPAFMESLTGRHGTRRSLAQVMTPDISDRTVYILTAEFYPKKGGLGMVMDAKVSLLRRLGFKVVVLTAEYPQKESPNGRLTPVTADDRKDRPFRELLKDDSGEPLVLTTDVHGSPIKFHAYKYTRDDGVEVIGVQDGNIDEGGRRIPNVVRNRETGGEETKVYVDALYRSPEGDHEFAEFLPKAQAEVYRYLQVKEREEKGSLARPGIVEANDGQSLLFALIRDMWYRVKESILPPHENGHQDPELTARVFEEAIVAGVTHTYKNTVYMGLEEGVPLLHKMRIPAAYWPYFIRRDENERYFVDFSVAGVRAAMAAGLGRAVSAAQAQEMGRRYAIPTLSGARNGDDLASTRRHWDKALMEAAQKLNSPLKNSYRAKEAHVREAKALSKESLNARLAKEFEKPRMDAQKMLVSYQGRLVPEKAGQDAAFTQDNIRAMVKAGVNVFINGVAVNERVERIFRDLESELREAYERASGPEKAKMGSFVFLANPVIDEDLRFLTLAATDVQIQPSDAGSEAAGKTESNGPACGAIQMGPARLEGILQEGVPMDFEKGVGNILSLYDNSPAAYLTAILHLNTLFEGQSEPGREARHRLSHYQRQSHRISQSTSYAVTVLAEMLWWQNAASEELTSFSVGQVDPKKLVEELGGAKIGDSILRKMGKSRDDVERLMKGGAKDQLEIKEQLVIALNDLMAVDPGELWAEWKTINIRSEAVSESRDRVARSFSSGQFPLLSDLGRLNHHLLTEKVFPEAMTAAPRSGAQHNRTVPFTPWSEDLDQGNWRKFLSSGFWDRAEVTLADMAVTGGSVDGAAIQVSGDRLPEAEILVTVRFPAPAAEMARLYFRQTNIFLESADGQVFPLQLVRPPRSTEEGGSPDQSGTAEYALRIPPALFLAFPPGAKGRLIGTLGIYRRDMIVNLSISIDPKTIDKAAGPDLRPQTLFPREDPAARFSTEWYLPPSPPAEVILNTWGRAGASRPGGGSSALGLAFPIWGDRVERLRVRGWSDRKIAFWLGAVEDAFIGLFVGGVTGVLWGGIGLNFWLALGIALFPVFTAFPLTHSMKVYRWKDSSRKEMILADARAVDVLAILALSVAVKLLQFAVGFGLWHLLGAPALGPPTELLNAAHFAIAVVVLSFVGALGHGLYDRFAPTRWPLAIWNAMEDWSLPPAPTPPLKPEERFVVDGQMPGSEVAGPRISPVAHEYVHEWQLSAELPNEHRYVVPWQLWRPPHGLRAWAVALSAALVYLAGQPSSAPAADFFPDRQGPAMGAIPIPGVAADRHQTIQKSLSDYARYCLDHGNRQEASRALLKRYLRQTAVQTLPEIVKKYKKSSDDPSVTARAAYRELAENMDVIFTKGVDVRGPDAKSLFELAALDPSLSAGIRQWVYRLEERASHAGPQEPDDWRRLESSLAGFAARIPLDATTFREFWDHSPSGPAIPQHRQIKGSVIVVNAAGKPLPGVPFDSSQPLPGSFEALSRPFPEDLKKGLAVGKVTDVQSPEKQRQYLIGLGLRVPAIAEQVRNLSREAAEAGKALPRSREEAARLRATVVAWAVVYRILTVATQNKDGKLPADWWFANNINNDILGNNPKVGEGKGQLTVPLGDIGQDWKDWIVWKAWKIQKELPWNAEPLAVRLALAELAEFAAGLSLEPGKPPKESSIWERLASNPWIVGTSLLALVGWLIRLATSPRFRNDRIPAPATGRVSAESHPTPALSPAPAPEPTVPAGWERNEYSGVTAWVRRGEGTPILYISGVGGIWAEDVKRFDYFKGRPVIIVNADRNPAAHRAFADRYLQGILDALSNLVPEGPYLAAAHCAGADIALRLAIARRPQGLFLLNPFAGHNEFLKTNLTWVLRPFRRMGVTPDSEEVKQALEDGYFETIQEHAVAVRAIGVPVAVVGGAEDPISPRESVEAVALALGVQAVFFSIPGAAAPGLTSDHRRAHALLLSKEHRAAVEDMAEEFFAQVENTGGPRADNTMASAVAPARPPTAAAAAEAVSPAEDESAVPLEGETPLVPFVMTAEERRNLRSLAAGLSKEEGGSRRKAEERLRETTYKEIHHILSAIVERPAAQTAEGLKEMEKDRQAALVVLSHVMDKIGAMRMESFEANLSYLCYYLAMRAEILRLEGRYAEAFASMLEQQSKISALLASPRFGEDVKKIALRHGVVRWSALALHFYDLGDFEKVRAATRAAREYADAGHFSESERSAYPLNGVHFGESFLEALMLMRESDALRGPSRKVQQERTAKLRRAIALLDAAIEDGNSGALVRAEKAGALWRLGERGAARREVRRALQMDPQIGIAHALRGQFLMTAASGAEDRKRRRLAGSLADAALEAFKESVRAPIQVDIEVVRIRLAQLHLYLQKARLAETDDERKTWEGLADGLLGIAAEFVIEEKTREEIPIEMFFHEWIAYREMRGDRASVLDLFLGQKTNKAGLDFLKRSAETLKTSSNQIDRWAEEVAARVAAGPRAQRANAVRFLGHLGESGRLVRVIEEAAGAKDFDLWAEGVEALGDKISELTTALLLRTAGQPRVMAKPRTRKLVELELARRRAQWPADADAFLDEIPEARAYQNAKSRAAQRENIENLRERMAELLAEAQSLRVDLKTQRDGVSYADRMDAFDARLHRLEGNIRTADDSAFMDQQQQALEPFKSGAINSLVRRNDGPGLAALAARFDQAMTKMRGVSPPPLSDQRVRERTEQIAENLRLGAALIVFDLPGWQAGVKALSVRINRMTPANFPEDWAWEGEFKIVRAQYDALRKKLADFPDPAHIQRKAPEEVRVLQEEMGEFFEKGAAEGWGAETDSSDSGGKWPWLDRWLKELGLTGWRHELALQVVEGAVFVAVLLAVSQLIPIDAMGPPGSQASSWYRTLAGFVPALLLWLLLHGRKAGSRDPILIAFLTSLFFLLYPFVPMGLHMSPPVAAILSFLLSHFVVNGWLFWRDSRRLRAYEIFAKSMRQPILHEVAKINKNAGTAADYRSAIMDLLAEGISRKFKDTKIYEGKEARAGLLTSDLIFLVEPWEGPFDGNVENHAVSFVVLGNPEGNEYRQLFAAVIDPKTGSMYLADPVHKRVWREGPLSPLPEVPGPIVAQRSEAFDLEHPLASLLEGEYPDRTIIKDVPSMTLLSAKMALKELGKGGAFLSSLDASKPGSAIATAFFQAARWEVTLPTWEKIKGIIRIDPFALSVPLPFIAAPEPDIRRYQNHYQPVLRQRIKGYTGEGGPTRTEQLEALKIRIEDGLSYFGHLMDVPKFLTHLSAEMKRTVDMIRGDVEVLGIAVGNDFILQVYGLARDQIRNAPPVSTASPMPGFAMQTTFGPADLRGPVVADGAVSLQWRVPAGPDVPWRVTAEKVAEFQSYLDQTFNEGACFTDRVKADRNLPLARIRLSLAPSPRRSGRIRDVDYGSIVWTEEERATAERLQDPGLIAKFGEREVLTHTIHIDNTPGGLKLKDVFDIEREIGIYNDAYKRSSRLPIRGEWAKKVAKFLGIYLKEYWVQTQQDETDGERAGISGTPGTAARLSIGSHLELKNAVTTPRGLKLELQKAVGDARRYETMLYEIEALSVEYTAAEAVANLAAESDGRNRESVEAIREFAASRKGQIPSVYGFEKRIYDFRGLAYAGRWMTPAFLAVHNDLLNGAPAVRDMALLHEFLEWAREKYLLDYALVTGKTGAVNLHFKFFGGAAGIIPLEGEALALAQQGFQDPHYFHRALARALFPVQDEALSRAIEESIHQNLAPVSVNDASEWQNDLYQAFKAFRENIDPNQVGPLLVRWLRRTDLPRANARVFTVQPILRVFPREIALKILDDDGDEILSTARISKGDIVIFPFLPAQLVNLIHRQPADMDGLYPGGVLGEFLKDLPQGTILASMEGPSALGASWPDGKSIARWLANAGLPDERFIDFIINTGQYEDALWDEQRLSSRVVPPAGRPHIQGGLLELQNKLALGLFIKKSAPPALSADGAPDRVVIPFARPAGRHWGSRGGRWPWLVKSLDRLVRAGILPERWAEPLIIFTESVLFVSGGTFLVAYVFALPIALSPPVVAVAILFQGLWHLFHMRGAPGADWRAKLDFAFSLEKLYISLLFMASVAAGPFWVDPSSVIQTIAWLLMSTVFPHGLINWIWGPRWTSDKDGMVVVGDLDARTDVFRDILRAEGLVDDNGLWRGGRGGVVQMGDIVGHAHKSLEAFHQLLSWQAQARAQGDRFEILLGNHEMEVLLGTHMEGDFTGDEVKEGHPSELRRLIAEAVIDGRVKAVLLLGPVSDPVVCTHAGISDRLPGLLTQLSDRAFSPQSLAEDLNTKLVEIAEYAIRRPEADLRKAFRDQLARQEGILMGTIMGVLNRSATFQHAGLYRGFRQLFGHTPGSWARYTNERSANVDTGILNGNGGYVRWTPKRTDLTQVRLSLGRSARLEYEVALEGQEPRPFNVLARVAEAASVVRLWVAPRSWLRGELGRADTPADLSSIYERFIDHLSRLDTVLSPDRLSRLYSDGYTAMVEAIWSRANGTRRLGEDIEQVQINYEDFVAQMVALWRKMLAERVNGQKSAALNLAALMFQLTERRSTPEPENSAVSDESSVRLKQAAIKGLPVPGVWELHVSHVVDRPGTLAAITAVLAANGLSILSADIGSQNGRIHDRFWVIAGPWTESEMVLREKDIQRELIQVLEGRVGYRGLFWRHGRRYAFKRQGGFIETLVGFSRVGKNDVIWVRTADRDRPGLLHALARWLHEEGLDIRPPARPIRTQGHAVYDELVVNRVDGRSLDDREKSRIARNLKILLDKDEIVDGDFPANHRAAGPPVENILEDVLYGGPLKPLPFNQFVFQEEALRNAALAERSSAEDRRDAVAAMLGGSENLNRLLGRSVGAGRELTRREYLLAADALAERHKRDEREGPTQFHRAEIRSLLRNALASRSSIIPALDRRFLRHLADAYNRRMGVAVLAEALQRAWSSGKRIVVEVTGDKQDETLLGWLDGKSDLGRVVFLLAGDGAARTALEGGLRKRFGPGAVIFQKADFGPVATGSAKFSVDRMMERINPQRRAAPAALFLRDMAEWEVKDAFWKSLLEFWVLGPGGLAVAMPLDVSENQMRRINFIRLISGMA